MLKKPENPNDPSSLTYKANKKREDQRRLQKENEKEYKREIVELK
jgi:hypothetical protein